MEIIRGLNNLRRAHFGCALAIGNFDGVHLGHQALLAQLVDHARQLALPATVMTFQPHPQEYFVPECHVAHLLHFREKLEQLKAQGVDRVLCVRFNAALASMSAGEFIDQLLVSRLGVKYLTVGEDFRFGAGRSGDIEILREQGTISGFETVPAPTIEYDGQRVSSTRVREALEQGDLALAEVLLDRPYSISGRVVHGDKRGREIGFPTANINLKRHKVPVSGVFAIEMHGLESGVVKGVANIGSRPTVDGQRTLLEVHLFDFDQTIYGRQVCVVLKNKIRDEKRFSGLEELTQQIGCDVAAARAYLATGC